jgi:hypothetical protein
VSRWTVERQLTYTVWAESEEEAVAVSRLLDPIQELATGWLEEEL